MLGNWYGQGFKLFHPNIKMERIYSRAEKHVKQEEDKYIKTRYSVVVVVSTFLFIYLLT